MSQYSLCPANINSKKYSSELAVPTQYAKQFHTKPNAEAGDTKDICGKHQEQRILNYHFPSRPGPGPDQAPSLW